jgi:hypothetical protein
MSGETSRYCGIADHLSLIYIPTLQCVTHGRDKIMEHDTDRYSKSDDTPSNLIQ